MADVLFGKNEFNAALAMLSHEGANGIVKLLNQGKQEEAFKYTAGLIDTWTNRASGTNGNVIDQMSKPYQITDWDRNQSVIDKKALGLDTRIRDMAAAYVQGRLGGNDAIHPKANFYLNKDLVDAFHLENPQKYSQSYRNWYDGANDVVSYGDKGRGGKNSTETQFVSTTKDRKVADSYKLVSRGDLNLKPTDSAQSLYFNASGDPRFSVDPVARINAPLGHIDVSQGLGEDGSPELANYTFGLDGPQRTARYFAPDSDAAPTRPTGTGIVGALNDFSDGITEGLEGAGRVAADVAGQIGGAISGLFPGASQPAPGPYDFASGSTAGDTSTNGDFGAGITPTAPAPAPGQYDFAGGLDVSGGVPNGSFGAGITLPGSQPAPTLSPSQAPTLGAGPQAAAVPFNGFDAQAYLAANQDVAQAGMDPLQHFLSYGFKESRTLDPQGHQIAPGFDAAAYLRDNPDVAAARIDPLTHYLVNGAAEGRTIGAGAATGTIGAPGAVSGLSPSGLSPLVGPTAGQSVTASPGVSDYDFAASYLNRNPDVAEAGQGAWEHFLRYGAKEGREINAAGDRFDPNAYLSQNADVLQAGLDPLLHYVQYGASEGRAAPIIGADGTVHNVSSLGVTPTVSAMLAPYLQPQSMAPGVPAPPGQTIGTPGLSLTQGAQTAPTIEPNFAPTIGAPDAVPSWSQGAVSPYQFGSNVSQGVAPGSFGAGISAVPQINPYSFSSGNFGGGIGATPQSLGGGYAVGSAVSNMGMDLPSSESGISPYGFGGNTNVSGFDVNGLGGGGAPEAAPEASAGWGEGAAAGFDPQASELAYLRGQEQKIRDANESARLLGQQITSVAPGNQTNYSLGAINTPVAPIQHTAFTPVNMSGVFAPLPTAAFMPRFTF